MRKIALALLTAALLGTAAADTGAPDSAPPKADNNTCVHVSDFFSWRAAPDAKSIFVRVNKRYLRLELAAACPRLTWPASQLITTWRGPKVACDALDWNLSIAQGGMAGPPVPCIVSKVHAMTPDEVAALPKNQRP